MFEKNRNVLLIANSRAIDYYCKGLLIVVDNAASGLFLPRDPRSLFLHLSQRARSIHKHVQLTYKYGITWNYCVNVLNYQHFWPKIDFPIISLLSSRRVGLLGFGLGSGKHQQRKLGRCPFRSVPCCYSLSVGIK